MKEESLPLLLVEHKVDICPHCSIIAVQHLRATDKEYYYVCSVCDDITLHAWNKSIISWCEGCKEKTEHEFVSYKTKNNREEWFLKCTACDIMRTRKDIKKRALKKDKQ